MSSNDTTLMERWIRRRDAEAFNEIVLRYSALVYGTCRRVLRDHADAEDVTQDCFLHLARSDSPPRRSLGGWLHALATHRALDRIKSQIRRRRREERFAAAREPDGASDWDEVQEFVDEAIDALPDKLRALIVAHFLEQRSQESIARELGLSRQTVTYRIAKGIETVRRKLERRGVAVVLTSLSTMLSTNLVEAAPVSLRAALGKIALAGARADGVVAASTGTAGAAPTLGVLGGIGVMYKFGIAAVIAIVFMLVIGYGLNPTEEDGISSAPDGGFGALGVATNSGDGDGERVASVEPGVAERAPEEKPPASTVNPDRLIRGRVVDPDGQAVGEALVAAGVKDGEKLVEVTADASGGFELEFPEAGSYVVCAFRDGVGLGAGHEAETGGEDVVVKLESLSGVSGRVFDRETGEGVDEIKIGLSYFGGFNRQDPERTRAFSWLKVLRSRKSKRGPDGHYRFENLLDARYLLELGAKGAGYVVPGTFGKPYLQVVLMKGEARASFDVALERAGAVSGRVFDPDAAPLSGARVHITSSKHSFSSVSSVKTDGEGGYRFGGLAVGGSYAVIVGHEGLAQSHSEAVTLSSAREIKGLDVHMSEGNTIFGKVVDDEGKGVPGARFRLGKDQFKSIRSHGREETVTDTDGSFRIEHVGPGKYSLVPRADGYESWRVRRLTMPADHDLLDQVFVLSPKEEGTVSGRVTDAAGKPLAQIRMLIDNDRRGPHVSGETYTDETGFYRFEAIGKAKTFRIGVYSQNYSHEEREQIPLNAEEVNFTLDRMSSVIGNVIDDETGEPVPDFEVRSTSYRNRGNGIPSEHWIPIRSNDGEFVLDDIEPPESEVEVRAKGYAPFVTERIKIRPEESIDVEIRLRRGAAIGGRTVDATTGQPLPGVRVRIYEQHYFHSLLMKDRRETLANGFQALTTTDEEGRFEFPGLTPEKELNLVAWRDGLGTQVLPGLLPPHEQEIRMHPEARLVTEVRKGSKPIEKIFVGVSLNDRPIGGADYQSGAWTSAQGIAELAGLRHGRYNIRLRTQESERLGSLTQEIPAGEIVKLKIDLKELEKRYARISGTIVGLSEPVLVSLSPPGDPKKTVDSTFWRPRKTSFRLGGISPGEYVLRAETKAKLSTEQKVTLRAGEELKLELELGK